MKHVIIPRLEALDQASIEYAGDMLENEGKREALDTLNWPREFPYRPITTFSLGYSSTALYIKYDVHGSMLRAKRRMEDGLDYGLVGEVVSVDPKPITDVIADGFIPVISTVAQGMDAETSDNVNADTAAAGSPVLVVHNAGKEASILPGGGNAGDPELIP